MHSCAWATSVSKAFSDEFEHRAFFVCCFTNRKAHARQGKHLPHRSGHFLVLVCLSLITVIASDVHLHWSHVVVLHHAAPVRRSHVSRVHSGCNQLMCPCNLQIARNTHALMQIAHSVLYSVHAHVYVCMQVWRTEKTQSI